MIAFKNWKRWIDLTVVCVALLLSWLVCVNCADGKSCNDRIGENGNDRLI